MENVLKYYEFSDFFEDTSQTFSFPIAFTGLNEQHFLIFEKQENVYNLYVSRYKNQKEIGKTKPEILELLVEDYDKSNPEHRIAIRRYLG